MNRRYRGRHVRFRRLKAVLRIAVILLLIIAGVWGFMEPKMLRVEQTSIAAADLDDGVGRLRIVYVSDIHMGSWPYLTMNDVTALITRINEQKADLVILGGDYAADSEGAISFFKNMPTIRSTYGVYAVLGECDRTLPESNLPQLLMTMRTRSITPLVNEVAAVRIGPKNIYLAGIDDVSASADIAGVAAQCSADDYVIFLSHNPEALTTALNVNGQGGKRNWFDLALCGHTMQGAAGAPAVKTSYSHGWYTPNRLNILVSQGVGTLRIPIRLGGYPTIHVITLRSEK